MSSPRRTITLGRSVISVIFSVSNFVSEAPKIYNDSTSDAGFSHISQISGNPTSGRSCPCLPALRRPFPCCLRCYSRSTIVPSLSSCVGSAFLQSLSAEGFKICSARDFVARNMNRKPARRSLNTSMLRTVDTTRQRTGSMSSLFGSL